ncbi:MAG: sulfatase-like hydrolase/transferase [Planctomycetota bacterium]
MLQDTAAEAAPAGQELQNPLIRSLGRMFDNSSGVEAEAGDILVEADSILSEIKDENAEAIKAVNRQVRLGNARPPNLLLIILDDVGYGELGCYGSSSNRTPHIDALAEAGVRFTDFYAGAGQDDGSWWCLMTGQDTSRAVQGKVSSFALQPQAVTLAETLWQAGYDAAFVGRWGLGSDRANMPHLHGFDEWFGLFEDPAQASDPLQHLFSNGAPVRLIVEDDRDPSRYIQQAVVAEAVSFLSRHAKGDPFLLTVSLAASPHGDRSRGESLTEADEDVGRIMAALGSEKLADKTIVFLLSDNGASDLQAPTGVSSKPNGVLRGSKGTLYEGGIRVPLVVRWPKKVQAGQVVSTPFAVWDLLPTLADAAGAVKRPRRLDGISMVPALLNKADANERLLYWESRRPDLAQAVRRGKWKVVRQAGHMAKEDVELYDLAADPGETTNVAAEFPEVVAEFIR